MPSLNIFKFFKKKEISEAEKEILKQPKKRRKRLRELWKQYEQGKILKIEEYKKQNEKV